jgi:hypothetical protein
MRHTEISYVPAVDALTRLHAELGGKIKDNRSEAKRLADMMRHVEAVLKMLRPEFDLKSIAARRRYKAASPYKRGEIFRTVLAVLREAPGPLTAREIAVLMLQRKGIENPRTPAIRAMFGAVNPSLRNHDGKTVARVGDGIPARWKIVV